jgi:hypothetical protein
MLALRKCRKGKEKNEKENKTPHNVPPRNKKV